MHQSNNAIMKKAVFTLLLTTIGLFAFSQWYWVNPSPTGQHLTDVFFVNDTLGFVVGQNGTILKTFDAGDTWNARPLNTLRHMDKVWFCDADTGFIACDSGFIFKTTNSGDDWIQIETGIAGKINDLLFLDGQTGFIAYDNGHLIKSTDGGLTWETKIDTTQVWPITSVSFANETRGIATTRLGRVYLTNDGGESWSVFIQPAMVDLVDSYFLNENECFVSGRFGFFMKSTDGGNSWTEVSNNVPIENLYFKDANAGFGLANELFYGDGRLYKTTDGGHNWIATEIDYCSAFTFSGDDVFYAVGASGRLLKSYDEGSSYYNYNQAVTYADLEDISFPRADTGYAIGTMGEVIKSTDAGKNWTILPQGPFSRLNGVWFTSADRGFVTTDSAVYATGDGGLSWNKVLSAPGWMTKIQFINSRTGFVIGEGQGLVYRTDDGGATWQLLYQDELEWPRGMHFVDSNTGYIALSYSVIKTTDGGNTWSQTNFNSNDPHCMLLEAFFVNSQVGYVAGFSSNSIVYKTTDGGNTWSELDFSDSYFTGLSIYFINENQGFLGCDGSGFFQTNDGGLTWTRLEYMTGYHDAITFSPDGTGFVVGSNGKIMKTNNKGMVPVVSPDNPKSEFTLYPNPATDEITLSCNDVTGTAHVRICNISGSCFYDSNHTGNNFRINVSSLTSGFYFVIIYTNKGIEVSRLVIL